MKVASAVYVKALSSVTTTTHHICRPTSTLSLYYTDTTWPYPLTHTKTQALQFLITPICDKCPTSHFFFYFNHPKKKS